MNLTPIAETLWFKVAFLVALISIAIMLVPLRTTRYEREMIARGQQAEAEAARARRADAQMHRPGWPRVDAALRARPDSDQANRTSTPAPADRGRRRTRKDTD